MFAAFSGPRYPRQGAFRLRPRPRAAAPATRAAPAPAGHSVEFVFGLVKAVTVLGRPLQVHVDQMVEGPDALQVGFSPGSLRRLIAGVDLNVVAQKRSFGAFGAAVELCAPAFCAKLIAMLIPLRARIRLIIVRLLYCPSISVQINLTFPGSSRQTPPAWNSRTQHLLDGFFAPEHSVLCLNGRIILPYIIVIETIRGEE